MKIESLRDLKKLISLCRKEGVNIIKIDGIEMVLEGHPLVKDKELPRAAKTSPDNFGEITADTKISMPDSWEELTDEQKLNWSSGAHN